MNPPRPFRRIVPWIATATMGLALGCQSPGPDPAAGVLALAPLLGEHEDARGITTVVTTFRRHVRTFEMIPRNEPWSSARSVGAKYALAWVHARPSEIEDALEAAAARSRVVVWTRPPEPADPSPTTVVEVSSLSERHGVCLLALLSPLDESGTAAAIDFLLAQMDQTPPAGELAEPGAPSRKWFVAGACSAEIRLEPPNWLLRR